MSSGKVLLGIIAGFAAGATLGILFAPDKGTNTRKKISEKGEEYMDDFKGNFEKLLVTATNELGTVASAAKNLVENAKEKLADVLSEIKNRAGEKL